MTPEIIALVAIFSFMLGLIAGVVFYMLLDIED